MAHRPLAFDPADGRPDTAFGAHWLSGVALVGGAVTSVSIPALFAGLMSLSALLAADLVAPLAALQPDDEQAPRETILEEVIQARFVQLGRDFRNELPDRQVPVLSTAPPEPSEVPRENTPTRDQPTSRVENRPPNTVDDLLTRLDRRAELFEEMAERRDVEGSPEGLEEGTERQGSEGDLYRGRLYSFFRRGWTIPTTLSRDESRRLTTTMNVSIGADLQLRDFEIRSSSQNPLFDDSVVQQLTRLQASSTPIPPPPDEVAEQYVGRTIAVRFTGREAGR